MKQRDFLFLLVSICVVVLAWIAFTIVHNSLTSTISTTTSAAIAPIDPHFDIATLQKMKKRIAVSPAFTISAIPTISVSPTVTPTPLPPLKVASGSSKLASPGGSLNE